MIEAGQILHNNPVGIPAAPFVEALLFAIRSEISRVYWNVHQKPFYGAGRGDIGGSFDDWADADKFGKPPLGIPGMDWLNYYNWSGSPGDHDWDQDAANRPNFSFDGVEVRWYKCFGRSMNVNVHWNPDQWVAWFDRCMAAIKLYETRNLENFQ